MAIRETCDPRPFRRGALALVAALGAMVVGAAAADAGQPTYTGRHVVNGHVFYGHWTKYQHSGARPAAEASGPAAAAEPAAQPAADARSALARPSAAATRPALLLPVADPLPLPAPPLPAARATVGAPAAPAPRSASRRRAARTPAVTESATATALARAAPRAGEAAVQTVSADETGYGGQLALPIGGSKILRFRDAVGRVLVGDPKVADVVPLSDHTLYVLAKAAGSTSLTVLPVGDAPHPLAAMDLKVGFDVDALKRAYHDTMPNDTVSVHAEGDALVLTGSVASSAIAARATALADHYAPGKVVNLMSVRGPEQVMLTVHVAEVQRQALRQLGITDLVQGFSNTGPVALAPLTRDPNAVVNIFNTGVRQVGGSTLSFEQLFTELEQKGFASTLAKPTLIALSGETAVFFAGGEFPVPVPQVSSLGAAQITVEFKQYGVSVGFTPTVYGDTINLALAPEVSSLDRSNSVNLQGYTIPGITTRRARTTVELRDGQSFAIAGLIRREFSDTLRGVPFAASLPIFGQLFRSSAYQNNETEVVIIVTVHLAKPTTRENLLLPTDTAGGPTIPDLFLMPHTDRPKPVAKPATPAPEVR